MHLTCATVAILDAGRNALSFFLLLVVALGLSVVRESLGRTMIRCQVLAVLHFIFGGMWFLSQSAMYSCPLVLYAVGIVELELESTSAFVLLLFVIPLAFTLSGFLLWILYALNGKLLVCTITWLRNLQPPQQQSTNLLPGNSVSSSKCSQGCTVFFCSPF